MAPSAAAASPQTDNPVGPPQSERLDPHKKDIHEALPNITEESVTYAKDTSESVASAATHAVDIFKATYAETAKRAINYNAKVFEIARDNISAALDHFYEISAVKSLPELIERSAENMRKQVGLFSAQARDLWGLSQKALDETTEPNKPGIKRFD